MKVLLIHTYYQQSGGEDAIFDQESALLLQSAQVETLSFRNKTGPGALLQFLLSIWNLRAAGKIKKAIARSRPDVIHIHNWHFAVGPLAIRVAHRAGIPVVLTINNYRLLCPSATLLYQGKLFTDSLNDAFPWKAVTRKVYRNSFFLTFWLAFVIWFHKKAGTWRMVDRYIVNTDFAKSLFVNSSFGIPEDKYTIKANFVNRPAAGSRQRGDHLLFIGRLVEEKGIRILLESIRSTNYELQIAGDGPLKEEVRKACEMNPNIRYLGKLDKEGVRKAMMGCNVLIFPSIWYEGMPMTIIEAFASGVPVIASNLGAMVSMIRHGYNGLLFETGNTGALTRQLTEWKSLDQPAQENYRQNTSDFYSAHYTPEKNRQELLFIYKKLTNEKIAY